jgi:hypothetical protein
MHIYVIVHLPMVNVQESIILTALATPAFGRTPNFSKSAITLTVICIYIFTYVYAYIYMYTYVFIYIYKYVNTLHTNCSSYSCIGS